MNKSKLKSITELLVLVIIIGFGAASCSYDDFVENEYDFTSVYLPKAQIDRSFIIEEGMQIGVGVVLGGRLSNTEDVEVTFSLDDLLVTDGDFTVLPTTHYELVDSEGNPANNTITIPAGKVQGFVYVKANPEVLLADPLSLGNNYALGFQLENVVKADSILENLSSSVITFTYINQLYGNYIQKGQVTKTPLEDDPATPEDETLNVETLIYPDDVTNPIEFTMVNPNTLISSGIADLRGDTQKLHIIVADDNTITIETAPGSIDITDDQGGFYNPETKEITLNYSFEFNDISYVVTEVLEFRNRVVDGVNQIDF